MIHHKGEETMRSNTDSVIGACYVETNSSNLANVGMYTVQDGSPLFDIAIIFAANINGTSDKPELYFNDTVTATLNSGAIADLQAKGIQVLLSILGNHQQAGITTLTGTAPQDFATQLANAVNQYGLDGVDFDDEYSTGLSNESSFPLLISSLRQQLPDKIISFYDFGPAAGTLEYDGIKVGDLINYSWNAIYGTFNPPNVPGLDNAHLAPAAANIDPGAQSYTPPSKAAALAKSTLKDNYGAYLYYNLTNNDSSDYLSQVSQVLYGQNTIYQGS